MRFEFFIAKRYLKSKHKLNFITIISIISTIGITLGVAALITVLSVFNGFSGLVTSILINFDPHVRITAVTEEGFRNISSLRGTLENTGHVESYYPFVEGKTIIKRDEIISIADLKGMGSYDENQEWGVKSNIKLGRYVSNDNDIVIGLNLATKLQCIVGDTIVMTSFNNLSRSALNLALPETRSFVIKGIFESNNNDYDYNYVFTSMVTAADLLGLRDSVQGYEIRLDNIDNSDEVKQELLTKISSQDYAVNTWYDLHSDLYSMMQIERWAAYIILSLIIAVATFNMLGSLSMSVIEKQKDIGVLRSMGARDKSVLRIFMFEGLLIGIIGTVTGSLIGLAITMAQHYYKLYPLDPTKYIIDALPVEIRITDFLAVAGMSLFLSFLASFYPAKKATKVSVIESIKWE